MIEIAAAYRMRVEFDTAQVDDPGENPRGKQREGGLESAQDVLQSWGANLC